MPDAQTALTRAIDRRIAAARDFEGLVDQVRQLGPAFRDFLRPPRVASLYPPAQGTVVAVNVTRPRCDALVVSSTGVRGLPLPELTLADSAELVYRHLGCLQELDAAATAVHRAYDRATNRPTAPAFHELHNAKVRLMAAESALDAELHDVMRWMWQRIAEPVLNAIGATRAAEPGAEPRVWWCPTGPLSFLPLHAAGVHDRAGESVLDRVVSSYTPTLRALAHANSATPVTGAERLLVVAVGEMQGEVALPQVARELDALTTWFPADRLTVLAETAATREAVLEALRTHRWVHFSCHARQHLHAPSSGGFLLSDGRLTVHDLGSGHYGGEFSFLSACMTGTGGLRLHRRGAEPRREPALRRVPARSGHAVVDRRRRGA
jgi:CHAT domain